jgi:hypothetical protein
VTCPSCSRQHAGGDPRLGPFCSVRCQQVDLGRWLSEEYRVPSQRETPSEAELEAALAQRPDDAGAAEDRG